MTVPFLTTHVLALCTLLVGPTWSSLTLAFLLFITRQFFVAAGYHRLFSHRAFTASAFIETIFALGAESSGQKGIFWWAAIHRKHHRAADSDNDPHNRQEGFLHAHVLWILGGDNRMYDTNLIQDLLSKRHLAIADRLHWLPFILLAIFSSALLGVRGLVVGFALSTVFVWHLTFLVNSICHSRLGLAEVGPINRPFIALLTLGEGWHADHHEHPRAARQSHSTWRIDMTYLALLGLQAISLVDLHPQRVRSSQ